MANEEQLYILQQGRSTWNTWRQQRLKELIDLYPDLSEADLSRICLSEANLSRAYLSRANLRGANLQGADLSMAYLRGANLQGANLSRANLFAADLFAADLSEADLSEANLRGANLRGANLRGANLQETRLTGAKHLTQDQLNTACVYENTQFPEGLIRPAPCPAKPKAFRTPLDFLAPYRGNFSQPTD
jgi:uncharacterized protein YjbI with pentapeptide repeats